MHYFLKCVNDLYCVTHTFNAKSRNPAEQHARAQGAPLLKATEKHIFTKKNAQHIA